MIPVLTTATIEVADPRYTGTALTVQTALGFALTVASIQLVPVLAGVTGWSGALAVLALGPVVGTVAMLRMGRTVVSRSAPRHAAPAPAAPAGHAAAAAPVRVGDAETVELYRIRRGGPPHADGLAGAAARALDGTARAERVVDPTGRPAANGRSLPESAVRSGNRLTG